MNLSDYLSEYSDSHRNPQNKIIHYICVPIIAVCTLTLLYAIHPLMFLLTFLAATIFYMKLSIPLAFLTSTPLLLGTIVMVSSNARVPLALFLFVAAWLGQFWGHKIEGKKPSFLKDILFLLIGPLWIANHLYQEFQS